MAIPAVIANIQDKWLSITGIKDAPDEVLENYAVFPFVATYERSGEMLLQSAGWSTPYTEIWSELHVSRQILPKAVATALAYRDSFLEKIRDDPTLSNTCQTVTKVTWQFGNLLWAGKESIGYRFVLTVKYHIT